ncbi:hypothetical protein MPSEU_000098400 [Mayamaea pseudoterrestris]|nr:hypothetical protein MPSEU_000098400 [Mayamaea pseudoterrestris]
MSWIAWLSALMLGRSVSAFHVESTASGLTRLRHRSISKRLNSFITTSTTTPVSSRSLLMSVEDNDDDSVNWIRQNNFNPFDYQAARAGGSTFLGTSTTSTRQPISYRKMQMQQVFSELLDAAGSLKTNSNGDADNDEEDILQTILQDNGEVVLAPLDTDDAYLDADSVIRPGMARTERYKVYLASLETRIGTAKSRQVKTVLEAIRNFVKRAEQKTET